MRWSTLTTLSLLAVPEARARSLLSRQVTDPEICTYERNDENAIRKTGSDKYLSDFLTRKDGLAWVHDNWLRALDEFSSQTADGGPFHSHLDCATMEDNNNCLTPDLGVECRWFTPPEVYWIRLWAPNVQTFFNVARNKVLKDAVSNAFKIDALQEDFNLGSFDKEVDFALISAIAWAVAPGLGYAAAVRSILKNEGSKKLENTLIFGNFAADETAAVANLAGVIQGRSSDLTPQELAEIIKGLYVDFFEAKYDHITNLNKQYFTGKDGVLIQPFIDSLKDMGVEIDTSLHPVAQILGSGAFSSGNINQNLDATLDAGFKMAKAQMIGALLAAQGVIVFGNTNSNKGPVKTSCTGEHDYWDGDMCLSWYRVQTSGRDLRTEPVDGGVLDKLGNYGIDAHEMMLSVKACGNRFQDDNADGSGFVNTWPQCWFAMPYFEADDSPQCMDPPPPGFDFQKCETEPTLPHGGPRID